MNKIRKGDEVVVLTGKDKGKRGKVLSRVSDTLVVVEGVNVSKKHARPNPMRGVTGGIIDVTMPIQQSNIALVDPKTQKATRVKVATVDGKRVRVAKSGDSLGA
jgi:large subunit ribosomal protein L24